MSPRERAARPLGGAERALAGGLQGDTEVRVSRRSSILGQMVRSIFRPSAYGTTSRPDSALNTLNPVSRKSGAVHFDEIGRFLSGLQRLVTQM